MYRETQNRDDMTHVVKDDRSQRLPFSARWRVVTWVVSYLIAVNFVVFVLSGQHNGFLVLAALVPVMLVGLYFTVRKTVRTHLHKHD